MTLPDKHFATISIHVNSANGSCKSINDAVIAFDQKTMVRIDNDVVITLSVTYNAGVIISSAEVRNAHHHDSHDLIRQDGLVANDYYSPKGRNIPIVLRPVKAAAARRSR